MAWTMLFSYPLMAAIQEISARIGRVTGQGIAGNIRKHYPGVAAYAAIVGLLLVANIINLGADLGAMGDALRLLIGGPAHLYVVAVRCRLRRCWRSSCATHAMSRILKWLTLSLFAYVATVLVVDVPWGEVVVRHLWCRACRGRQRLYRRRSSPSSARRSAPICSSGRLPGGRGRASQAGRASR